MRKRRASARLASGQGVAETQLKVETAPAKRRKSTPLGNITVAAVPKQAPARNLRSKRVSAAGCAPETSPPVKPTQQDQQERSAAECSRAGSDLTFASIPDGVLDLIFQKLDDPPFCRDVLPLVCKSWLANLQRPSGVWKAVHFNFQCGTLLQKVVEVAAASSHVPSKKVDPSRLERWLRKRSTAVECLSFNNALHSSQPLLAPEHPSQGVRALLRTPLPNLQDLFLQNCGPEQGFGHVLGRVGCLTSLQQLFIFQDGWQWDKKDLAHLTKLQGLKVLSLGHKPGAGSAEHFRTAAASVGVPTAVYALTSLTSLVLSSPGIQGTLNGRITRLRQLTSLSFHTCSSVRLPNCLSSLTALRTLNIADTRMFALPSVASRPQLDGLTALRLQNVTLALAPTLYVGAPALHELDVSGNNMSFEGSCYGIASLKVLNMAQCQLTAVPEMMHLRHPLLTHLNLSDNALVDLAPSMTNLTNLAHLNLSGNMFPRVPEVLLGLTSLTHLDMSRSTYLEVAAWDSPEPDCRRVFDEPLTLSPSDLPMKPFKDLALLPSLQTLDFRKHGPPFQKSSLQHLQRLADLLHSRRGHQIVLL